MGDIEDLDAEIVKRSLGDPEVLGLTLHRVGLHETAQLVYDAVTRAQVQGYSRGQYFTWRDLVAGRGEPRPVDENPLTEEEIRRHEEISGRFGRNCGAS